MTPEAENELVARWMGKPGDWRTDQALLWELLQRLGRCGWSYSEFATEDRAMVTLDAFNAEAVFAAAVVQAQEDA